jgi:YD repeat-containing protein
MLKRKSVALYRKNLSGTTRSTEPAEYWLYSHSEYDQNGNLTEQTVFTQNGLMVEKIMNEYDDIGFLVREKYIVDEDEPAEEKSYERNENGLVLKEFKHYTDGSYDTTIYTYDSQHRIVSKITSDDGGEVELKMLNEYRGDFLFKTQLFDGEDILLQSDEFSYDEKGNSAEHRHIDNETGENTRVVTEYNSNGRKKCEIRYDEDGDVISETAYHENENGLLLSITEENEEGEVVTRFEYDVQGNQVSQLETDEEGTEKIRVLREFDEASNLVRSEVFVDGQGRAPDQHYELKFEYQFYQE